MRLIEFVSGFIERFREETESRPTTAVGLLETIGAVIVQKVGRTRRVRQP